MECRTVDVGDWAATLGTQHRAGPGVGPGSGVKLQPNPAQCSVLLCYVTVPLVEPQDPGTCGVSGVSPS